mmetsp:Transcript_10237/g.19345  ORF Transcript_10237/g.19345 Transcript_10237/m.19345 type:complete len:207 (+) Transcript_10237:1107-1727(+)
MGGDALQVVHVGRMLRVTGGVFVHAHLSLRLRSHASRQERRESESGALLMALGRLQLVRVRQPKHVAQLHARLHATLTALHKCACVQLSHVSLLHSHGYVDGLVRVAWTAVKVYISENIQLLDVCRRLQHAVLQFVQRGGFINPLQFTIDYVLSSATQANNLDVVHCQRDLFHTVKLAMETLRHGEFNGDLLQVQRLKGWNVCAAY